MKLILVNDVELLVIFIVTRLGRSDCSRVGSDNPRRSTRRTRSRQDSAPIDAVDEPWKSTSRLRRPWSASSQQQLSTSATALLWPDRFVIHRIIKFIRPFLPWRINTIMWEWSRLSAVIYIESNVQQRWQWLTRPLWFFVTTCWLLGDGVSGQVANSIIPKLTDKNQRQFQGSSSGLITVVVSCVISLSHCFLNVCESEKLVP